MPPHKNALVPLFSSHNYQGVKQVVYLNSLKSVIEWQVRVFTVQIRKPDVMQTSKLNDSHEIKMLIPVNDEFSFATWSSNGNLPVAVISGEMHRTSSALITKPSVSLPLKIQVTLSSSETVKFVPDTTIAVPPSSLPYRGLRNIWPKKKKVQGLWVSCNKRVSWLCRDDVNSQARTLQVLSDCEQAKWSWFCDSYVRNAPCSHFASLLCSWLASS